MICVWTRVTTIDELLFIVGLHGVCVWSHSPSLPPCSAVIGGIVEFYIPEISRIEAAKWLFIRFQFNQIGLLLSAIPSYPQFWIIAHRQQPRGESGFIFGTDRLIRTNGKTFESNVTRDKYFLPYFFFFPRTSVKTAGTPFSFRSHLSHPSRHTRRYTPLSSRFMTWRFLAPLHPLTHPSAPLSASFSLLSFFCFSLKLFLQNSLRFPLSFLPLRETTCSPFPRCSSQRLRFSRWPKISLSR